MSKIKMHSNSAERLPDSGRRGFLSWLGGVTALGLGGGLVSMPAVAAAGTALGARPELAATAAGTAAAKLVTTAAVPAMPFIKGGRSLLDTLNLDSFTPHLNSRFVFRPISLDEAPAEAAPEATAASPQPVTLELVEAKEPKSRQEVKVTESFMLVFRGPANEPLAQETYEVRHAGVGTFPLFIVPIGQDDAGLYYQAIFNRLIQA